MGREVRRVAPGWKHPKTKEGYYRAMEEGSRYEDDLAEWERYREGDRPKKRDYMPDWTEEEATHFMMYETMSEGTPLSPAFATPEELARWCVDNNVDRCGTIKATYEEWLSIARGAYGGFNWTLERKKR